MFLNYTNHPNILWSESQRNAASAYGDIVDLPFPDVLPDADEKKLDRLAEHECERILDLHPSVVMCQGEMTLTYRVVSILTAKGIPVMAACSERISEEKQNPDGSTTTVSKFVFKRFRLYQTNTQMNGGRKR